MVLIRTLKSPGELLQSVDAGLHPSRFLFNWLEVRPRHEWVVKAPKLILKHTSLGQAKGSRKQGECAYPVNFWSCPGALSPQLLPGTAT